MTQHMGEEAREGESRQIPRNIRSWLSSTIWVYCEVKSRASDVRYHRVWCAGLVYHGMQQHRDP